MGLHECCLVSRCKACLYIFLYVPLLGKTLLYAFSTKVNDSMIIKDSPSLGGKGLSKVFSKTVSAVTFRTAFKAVGKNSENMSSRMYNFSTMQNITMNYELYKGLHRPKRTEVAVL